MSRQPDLPCADCGKPMWSSRTSLPAGRARCQPCRAIARGCDGKKLYEIVCEWCGKNAHKPSRTQRYCSRSCFARADGQRRLVRPADSSHQRRNQRESAAPGLGDKARARLNHKWQKQGRQCTYCTEPADTVDHVVPLVRGGTNHEGNLAPCCRRCNSSKAGHLIAEWRTGRRLPRMTAAPSWPARERKPSKAKPPRPLRECSVCSLPTANKTCSKTCADERLRRMVRDSYRRKVGLPVDENEPTRTWKRENVLTITGAIDVGSPGTELEFAL